MRGLERDRMVEMHAAIDGPVDRLDALDRASHVPGRSDVAWPIGGGDRTIVAQPLEAVLGAERHLLLLAPPGPHRPDDDHPIVGLADLQRRLGPEMGQSIRFSTSSM